MLAVALLFFVSVTAKLEASEINCEKVVCFDRFEKCCFLNGATVISEDSVTIADLENSGVQAVLFSFNQKIEYFPVNVYKKFPNLEVFLARRNTVKKISASNFQGLSNLKFLDLQENQIEIIPDDCFQGLIKVQKINLRNESLHFSLNGFILNFSHTGSNKIKTVNGIAFVNLPQVVVINLRQNSCIGKVFEIQRGSNNFRRRISRHCASADVVKKQLSCISPIACNEERRSWYDHSGCCELDYGTVIDATDFSFIADKTYTIFKCLNVEHQPNIEFLPISLHERFPNLKVYSVKNAPVRKISKKNFEKMFRLEQLFLDRNQINVIKRDTFEDLINLEFIEISTYKAFLCFWSFIYGSSIHRKPTSHCFEWAGICKSS